MSFVTHHLLQSRSVDASSRSGGLPYQPNATYRQIFLDGRALPNDPNPAWNGYSVGRWEGDSLVVDSIGPEKFIRRTRGMP